MRYLEASLLTILLVIRNLPEIFSKDESVSNYRCKIQKAVEIGERKGKLVRCRMERENKRNVKIQINKLPGYCFNSIYLNQ